ncbi:TSR3 [Hepatospora eriocheir]|uniref:18S rRNA aminocarboxypropyltransferase n=1 Tax=Hepatospora eriocheir TaxID=1081669 RepID=A0A1X0QE54_9MICR|nr:TSR3 [Hepatospora eriocheir]
MKEEDNKVKLIIYEFNQCDPKKCSGHRLVKFNKVKPISIKSRFNGIMLSPEADKFISKEDLNLIKKFGLGTIDCSWNKIDEFNFKSLKSIKSRERHLPFLYAGNTINYGKPYKLNCLEAYASALYILGFKEQSIDLFEGFSYVKGFFNFNKELLEKYSNCETNEEIKKTQEEILKNK